jgi:hypothetical protein
VSCEERRDQVLFFATGALDAEEAEALRAHLRSGCSACAAHLAEARRLELDLLLGLEPEAPPPALRARLMQRVETSRTPARPHRSATPPAPPRPSRGAAAWIRSGLAAAAAAAVAALVTYQTTTRPEREARLALAAERSAQEEQRARIEAELAELREEKDEADAELGELEERMASLERALESASDQVAMLRSPDVKSFVLAGTAAQPEARARVFWEWNDYYCYVHGEKLRALAAGEVYALWLDTEKSGRILAGTLEVGGAGEGTLWVQLPRDAGKATGAMVTVERAPAGQAPAGAPELVLGPARAT